MQGRVTVFVGGVGTGGTLSGVSQYLKEQTSAGAFRRHQPGLGGMHAQRSNRSHRQRRKQAIHLALAVGEGIEPHADFIQ